MTKSQVNKMIRKLRRDGFDGDLVIMTMAKWYRDMDATTVAEDLGIDSETTEADLADIAENIECLCLHDRNVVLTGGVEFCRTVLAVVKGGN